MSAEVTTLVTRQQQQANVADLLRKQLEFFLADPSTENRQILLDLISCIS